MEASCLADITDLVLDDLVNRDLLPYDKREAVRKAIGCKHSHQYQRQQQRAEKLPLIRSLAEIGRRTTLTSTAANTAAGNGSVNGLKSCESRLGEKGGGDVSPEIDAKTGKEKVSSGVFIRTDFDVANVE